MTSSPTTIGRAMAECAAPSGAPERPTTIGHERASSDPSTLARSATQRSSRTEPGGAAEPIAPSRTPTPASSSYTPSTRRVNNPTRSAARRSATASTIEATIRARSRSATSDRLTPSTRSIACNRWRRSSSSLAERSAAESDWATISASATWAGPIGRSSVPSKLTTARSSSPWTTGAATSVRTSARAAR